MRILEGDFRISFINSKFTFGIAKEKQNCRIGIILRLVYVLSENEKSCEVGNNFIGFFGLMGLLQSKLS